MGGATQWQLLGSSFTCFRLTLSLPGFSDVNRKPHHCFQRAVYDQTKVIYKRWRRLKSKYRPAVGSCGDFNFLFQRPNKMYKILQILSSNLLLLLFCVFSAHVGLSVCNASFLQTCCTSAFLPQCAVRRLNAGQRVNTFKHKTPHRRLICCKE